MADDTPFDDIGPWCNVDIAGKRLGVYLTAIDGVSTKWEWQEQKASGSSGAKQVYKGQKKGHPKLTFTATDKADFQELGDIWNMIVPKPGQSGGSAKPAASTSESDKLTAAAKAKDAVQEAIGKAKEAKAAGDTEAYQQAQADANKAAAEYQESTGGSGSGSGTTKKSSEPDPGPRPPTLPISNRILEWHGITAFAAEEWVGPTPGETGEWTVVLTIIPQDPPKPAGSGAMTPAKPGSQFSGGSPVQNGPNGSGAGSGSQMDKNAAAGAAGT
jgi:hypothetical protein